VLNKIIQLLRGLPVIKQCISVREDLAHLRKLSTLVTIHESIQCTLVNDYLNKYLYENPAYQNPKKLNKYEYKTFSQNGEDGIIEEIFLRIGDGNKFFVEFGAANGLANNTTFLLVKGWHGLWIERDRNYEKGIKEKFGSLIFKRDLTCKFSAVTAANIEQLFHESNVPKEFDLLAIDIDGNDYWIWKAIQFFRPRVVVIEYNRSFGPRTKWVMKYNPNHIWRRGSYCGASLKSLEILGENKGYCLVGCDFRGVNAFFVRKDLTGGSFF